MFLYVKKIRKLNLTKSTDIIVIFCSYFSLGPFVPFLSLLMRLNAVPALSGMFLTASPMLL